MDYLSFITGEFDRELEEKQQQAPQEEPIQVPNPLNQPDEPGAVDEKVECRHNQVLGDPRSGAICLDCNEHLSGKQMKGYRQFGLDASGSQNVYSREDYGISQVNEIKQELIKSEKLVLVLDLDNTLLHSSQYVISPEMVKRQPVFKR